MLKCAQYACYDRVEELLLFIVAPFRGRTPRPAQEG